MIDNNDPTEISTLASTQYLELTEIIQCISKALSDNEEETRNVLIGYGLSMLRPMAVQPAPDWIAVEDTSDKNLIDAITHRLGGLPFSALSEDAQYYSSHCEFYWGIPTLINWCHHRRLLVPDGWNQWMNHTYPALNDRELIDNKPGTVKTKVKSRKQEIRKHQTQARHSVWQKEYKRIKIKHPGKRDTWIANKIAKNKETAGDCKAETIRRIMKN